MSKPVKNMIAAEYQRRFGELDSAVLIDIRGVDANTNNAMRAKLNGKEMRVTIVKNSLAKRVFEGTALDQLSAMLEGPCAMVYGGESAVEIARELVELADAIDALDFKGAIMEGTVFGPDEIVALSKYPTRDEAISQTLQIVLTPAQKLVGSVLGPGRTIASLVNAIEEKLEAGEEIKAA